ncbi:MAG: zinc-binding dehydrogenase [Bacteroidia bacterium]|nr:zinc-binding dehydrogenase [Bacteroidia bacterium]MDW8416389.1 zinc-binding dehydrogenase [Bacteroidia bacterium]
MLAWKLYEPLPRNTQPGENVWEKVLKLEEVELPPLPPNYARVRLYAAALNRRDLWITLGLYPNIKCPAVLGSDGCGEVVQVSTPSHREAWLGKRVLINPSLNWGSSEQVQSENYEILGMPSWGTMAEYVDVPVENLHPIPEHLSVVEAAAVPLAGLTAYRAVFVQGQLQAGEKVLIPGIGGGVALWALQLAVAAGAEVWVTSSSENKLQTAKRLGAAGGVLYTQSDWAEYLYRETGGFHLIVDGVGGDVFPAYLTISRPGARIVVYGATRGNPPNIDLRRLFWKQLHLIGSTMGSPANFAALLQFISANRIHPLVETILPFSDLPKALYLLWTGQQIGKIVLKSE